MLTVFVLLAFALCASAVHVEFLSPRVRNEVTNLTLTERREKRDQERRADLRSFFCWTVNGPSDTTVPRTIMQIRHCGGYAVFSNYTNEETHTIKLYNSNMKVGLTPEGWTSNTDMFLKAWYYIANSSWPDSYQWFVKVDADTFLRAQFLPQAVATINSSDPVALTVDGRIRGALEVMSYMVFRHPNSKFIYSRWTEADRDAALGGEDVWIDYAFKHAGFKLMDATKKDGCISFLISYFNLPHMFSDLPGHPESTDSTRNVLPEIIDYLGSSGQERLGYCIHSDVIAIHPVKDLDVYRVYQDLDSRLDEEELRRSSMFAGIQMSLF